MARLGRARHYRPLLPKRLPSSAIIYAYAPDGGSTATGGTATVVKTFAYVPDGGSTSTGGSATVVKTFVYVPDGGSTTTGGSATTSHDHVYTYTPDGGATTTGGSATIVKTFAYAPDGGSTATGGTATIGKSFVYKPDGGSTTTGGSAGLGHGALRVYTPNGGATTTGGTAWVIVTANRAAVATTYGPFTVQTDATQIRNDVTVTGGTMPVVVTDTFTADGLAIYWPLSYPPDTSSDVATPTVTVGGVTKTVSSAGSGSISSQYGLQTLGNQYVALLAGTDGVPASGTVLSITYTYQAPVQPRLVNATSVAVGAALPNAGYFSAQPPQSPGATLAAAVQAAQSQLTLYSGPFTTVNVQLPQSYSGTGLEEDQQIQFVSNRLGVNLQMALVKIGWAGGQGASAGLKTMQLSLEA